ncbi:TetR/AcrR family transcriptional regulator [Actinomadura barringtoniae]|uniref:TetR/AcrR family transcriptional regulator n=1 Tax=Actinomadura barringtoniae TaxID=1427535 RepID=A0A939P739_9ACTN|nr:TetR/AcrR family transcriptional regulator [Actinomadura barringtoniae]MBO2446595.1 TetR/AcrR family transcriptional regulator [Actinomadura barringtoniae]
MPRVSEEHLERRRTQILDAARTCFVRKGFHETSMQDIFAESGMSAGAVYRYFKSKTEIIQALASDAIGGLAVYVADVLAEDPVPPLDDAVGRLTSRITSMTDGLGATMRLAPQAWALALYNEEFGDYVRERMTGFRELWVIYVERLRDAGMVPADTDCRAAGKALFGMLPGFVIQYLLVGDITPEEFRRGLRALASSTALAPDPA